jgi:hypothetical protein
MAASAPSPPGDPENAPGFEEPEDSEMTSIMDADQRRELQKAARSEAARTKEPERVTAPPPADAAAVATEETTRIPKAAAIPAEARPNGQAPAAQAVEKPAAAFSTWMVVAFVLLAAAVVFALRT